MAAFASSRRSGCVRVLVVILCALFILATLAAPPAQALAVESVAVLGLASVLSAATAALGFKLASNEQGQATLQKMVQDFKTVAWATGLVLVGSKLNGLQNGMDYIKMQVQNGKTYLDSRVFAWVQQWLAQNGVYETSGISIDYSELDNFKSGYISVSSLFFSATLSDVISAAAATGKFPDDAISKFNSLASEYNLYNSSNYVGFCLSYYAARGIAYIACYPKSCFARWSESGGYWSISHVERVDYPENKFGYYDYCSTYEGGKFYKSTYTTYFDRLHAGLEEQAGDWYFYGVGSYSVSGNDTGLSGTDTLGKDVVDLTLDQVLQKLKEWAQDWFDAGADSATNAATGALDLPLTVATGAATSNPSIAEDGPLVWFPPFSVPIPNLRTGETDTKTVDQGKENASAAETSTVDVAENQTVIDSLVNWALSYISPDTGLFSKFPLCVPYDAYLLVTSSLGVDAVGSDSIFGASPGDLEGVVSQDIDTYSDFQPIINIKHDFELDGKTYPVELTIDLTPWQPFITFFREGMALLLIAELIGSEFKRIRGH